MAFPSSKNNTSLSVVVAQMQAIGDSIKQKASDAVPVLAGGNVTTAYVFSTLDQLSGAIGNLNAYKNVVGLNAHATANIPGYAGTLTTDTDSVIAAAQACIDWVVTHTSGSSWYTLNADGTRTMATFTPTQTAGFRTALNALVATIS